MDSVKCPHCGKQVQLSEAIIHELAQKVREEEQKKLKAQFDKEKADAIAKREKKIREEIESKNKEKDKELEKERLERQILEKKLKKEHEEREKIEEKIEEEAKKDAREEQRVVLKQKDIQIEQVAKVAEELRKANENLKRKLEQGSQQLQGEALEQDFEEKLKSTFPGDQFLPVPKGVEGGDIWHKILYKGDIVGSILWETKRTKAWQKAWLAKLRADTRKINATESIIVSEMLPPDVKTFTRLDGVWVTKYSLAINLAQVVRFLILSVQSAKGSSIHSDEDIKKIRDYVLSDKFRHTMDSHFEHIEKLRKNQRDQERVMSKIWRDNQASFNELDSNISNFYLDLKDIVPNIPIVKSMETPLLGEVNDEEINKSLF